MHHLAVTKPCSHFLSFNSQTEVRIKEADLNPIFVQVALLSKGDCFVRIFNFSFPSPLV